MKTLVNLNFLQNDQLPLQYRFQTWKFSRSRMRKQTSPLDLSQEVGLHRRMSLNSEVDGISCFSRQLCYVTHGMKAHAM